MLAGDSLSSKNEDDELTNSEKKHAESVNIRNAKGIEEDGRPELRQKLLAARSAKTFTNSKSTLLGQATVQPVPWPMPPRRPDSISERELSSVLQKKETDNDYLTPQSSFTRDDAEPALEGLHVFASDLFCDGSADSFSRDSTVKRESFSSLGTGVSTAVANPSDSESSESVSQVDIDADEFSLFLSDKTNSDSYSDDVHLFEGGEHTGQNKKNSSFLSKKSSSEASTTSSTPKAIRVPSGTRKKSQSGTVSLIEALTNGSDGKPNEIRFSHEKDDALRKKIQHQERTAQETFNDTENRAALISQTSKNIIARNTESPSLGRQEEEFPGTTTAEDGSTSGLRRPMASRGRTFVILPQPSTKAPPASIETGESREKTSSREEKDKMSHRDEERKFSPLPEASHAKGIIVRSQTHVSNVAGIRRAETGRIMSRAELKAQKPMLLHESPNPKSLHPAAFSNEEDEVTTANPSQLSASLSSDTEEARSPPPSANSKTSLKEVLSSSASNPTARVDDGSFLSPGLFSRKKKFGAEEYAVDSFQFSEHDESSGLLNMVSSGFRKMHMAVGKKASSHEIAARSGIVVSGTIDEMVCKICVLCRKQLQYNVYVKDTGKKIKVESRSDKKSSFLRATLLVREMPGTLPRCEINIRQSRSDGMKTGLATLWSFYQRLELGLNAMD